MLLIIASIGTLTAFLIVKNISIEDKQNQILGVVIQNDTVNVTTDINTCIWNLTVLTEKRIPTTGNWGTNVDIDIYDISDTYVDTLTGTTDANGDVVFDLCSSGIAIPPGQYDIYVRGTSHLRKNYANKNTFDLVESTLDLSPYGDLVAGETSVFFNNQINALDISTQLSNYFTADNKNDLNQDGVVNIFDISSTVQKLYLNGECSGQDQIDGACPY